MESVKYQSIKHKKNIYNIKKLQQQIHRLLKTSSIPDDSLIFNITDKTYYNNSYHKLLSFTKSSLEAFLSSDDICKSYFVPDISDEEKEHFRKKIIEYNPYKDVQDIRIKLLNLTRKPNATKKSIRVMPKSMPHLTYQELFTYNREYHIRKYMQDKDYNKKTPRDIFKIFEDRVEEMVACLSKEKGSRNKTKTEDEVNYLEIESHRESVMLSSIKTKSMEDLQKMANYIMWGSKQTKCYYNDDGTLKDRTQLEHYVNDKILKKLRIAKENDVNCVKKMMTFLPLSIFKLIKKTGESFDDLSLFEDGDEFDYDEDKLREYYIYNGTLRDYNTETISEDGIIKGLNTQFRLGIGYDLFQDKIGKLYSDILGLWSVYVNDLDLFNSCGKYVNYSIYLNLLQIYIFMIRNNSVFPISFSLRKEIIQDNIRKTYNQNSESYEFRNKDPISKKNLFNEDMKLIGVHFIKYTSFNKHIHNEEIKVLSLFVFINKKFNDRKEMSKGAIGKTTIGNEFISSYMGDEREIITCDQRMYFIEDGEITPAMSLTYHELTNILFYGAKTYMIGNDTKELYFTMAEKDNSDLQKLIKLLNMKEVFFVKGPVEGFTKERFKIMTEDEARKTIKHNKGELMGNQNLGSMNNNRNNNRNRNSNNLKNNTVRNNIVSRMSNQQTGGKHYISYKKRTKKSVFKK